VCVGEPADVGPLPWYHGDLRALRKALSLRDQQVSQRARVPREVRHCGPIAQGAACSQAQGEGGHEEARVPHPRGVHTGDLQFDKDVPLPNWDLKPAYIFDLLPKQVIEPTAKVVAKPVPIIASVPVIATKTPKPPQVVAPVVDVPLIFDDAVAVPVIVDDAVAVPVIVDDAIGSGEEETSPSDESACHLM
jgi:hypothetical protein